MNIKRWEITSAVLLFLVALVSFLFFDLSMSGFRFSAFMLALLPALMVLAAYAGILYNIRLLRRLRN